MPNSTVTQLRGHLPHPPGINRTYRSTTGGRWYKTDAARLWEQDAVIYLRAAGFKSHDPGAYWLSLDLVLRTCRLDLDGPLKLAIDAVSAALSIDDRWLGRLTAVKIPVHHGADQGLDVRAEVRKLADSSEFSALARRVGATPWASLSS